MKVQYIKKHTDGHGFTFCPGWTAEHTDAEAQKRINAGLCIEAPKDTRARRAEVITTECIPLQAPALTRTETHTKTRK